MKRSLILLAILFLSAKSLLALETEYSFKVSTYVLEKGKKTDWGSGSLTTEGNQYGRFGFTFFKGIDRVSIIATAGGALPVTHLLSESEPSPSVGELFLATDLYLKASPAEGKLIRLKGALVKLIRAESKGSPLFHYSEEKLELVLPDNGKKSLLIGEDKSGKQIYLDISIQVKGGLVSKEEEITHHVTFNTEYYLYNQDSKKYELEYKGCVLGLAIGPESGEATCFQHKVYKLQKNDSLLYISAFEIKNPTFTDSDKIKFQIEVTHTYAVNPIMEETWPEELKSDKTTVILFSKEISAKTGERTEIEIPQDQGSLLPFKSKETIVLINSVKEVKK